MSSLSLAGGYQAGLKIAAMLAATSALATSENTFAVPLGVGVIDDGREDTDVKTIEAGVSGGTNPFQGVPGTDTGSTPNSTNIVIGFAKAPSVGGGLANLNAASVVVTLQTAGTAALQAAINGWQYSGSL